MVYGVLLMVNFAHSELFMLGAVAGWFFLSFFVGPAGSVLLAGTFIVAVVVAGGTAVLLNRVAYAPLRKSSRLTPLISSIGASLFLQNIIFLWKDSQLAFPSLFP